MGMSNTILSAAQALLNTALRASEAAMSAEEAGFRRDAEEHHAKARSAGHAAAIAWDTLFLQTGDDTSKDAKTLQLAATYEGLSLDGPGPS